MSTVTIQKNHYDMLIRVAAWVDKTFVAPEEWISEAEAIKLTGWGTESLKKKRAANPGIFRHSGNGNDKEGRPIRRKIQYNKPKLLALFTHNK